MRFALWILFASTALATAAGQGLAVSPSDVNALRRPCPMCSPTNAVSATSTADPLHVRASVVRLWWTSPETKSGWPAP